MTSQKHIVITVFGSLGDLHPPIALALGLQQRGHRVTIATTRLYQEKVEAEGIGFHPLRPDMDLADDRIYDELFDPVRGPETLMRKYIFPFVRETYADLKIVLKEADFLINSPLIVSGPLLARELQLPWASLALQPFFYLSAYDPPVLPLLPASESWYGLGSGFWKLLIRWLKSTTRSWHPEFDKFQKELGIANYGSPVFDGMFSPHLNLGMFSDVLGKVQPDWPANTYTTGFLFYDRMKPDEKDLPEPIHDFLKAGEPPVVFTLGSSAVRTAGNFYDVSVEVAKRLNFRAIFLAGENSLKGTLPNNMLMWDYASYSQLFPHAAVVVHQGGAGTTAQTLRAGKPMIVVPFGFDQFDNAARMKRLGVSQTILRKQYTVDRVAKTLEHILTQPGYSAQAKCQGEKVRGEDGVSTACHLIEPFLYR